MLGFSDISQWLFVLLLVYLIVPFLAYTAIPFLLYGTKSTKKRIIIYVIGDIGHSPRMCYHALSFSKNGWQVELCGYVGDSIPKVLINDSNITIHELPVLKSANGSSVLFLFKKVVFQVYHIVKQLWELRGSNFLLIQNPPTIPILPIVAFYRFAGTKLIIDWHNLGYSILQLKFNNNFYHPLVIVAYMVEYIFGKFADYNLTVTKAMKAYLVKSFGLDPKRCIVLYDRPANQFTPYLESSEERAKLLRSEPFIKDLIPKDFDILKNDKILVTSTSFTSDEDLGILIGALKIYENSFNKFDGELPKILCFITGKGPLKEKFIKQVKEHTWTHCKIEFVWLKAEDYPRLLRLCDYGVSLHTSSSGLDLPMKILDMFGSGLPVLAMNYEVLNELVKHNYNGMKFTDRRELHESLIFAMKDEELYSVLRENVIEESGRRWDSSWEPVMKDLNMIK